MLADAEALKKPLCSFLSFLSLDSLYNRLANISGPIDGDERHPLSQSVVNLHRDCPHRRRYPSALPKYGLIDLTLAFPRLSQGQAGHRTRVPWDILLAGEASFLLLLGRHTGANGSRSLHFADMP